MSINSRTALITGASAGIGAAFARHLASEGYALLLVARRLDRLKELANELTAQHGVRCDVFAADLNDPAAPEEIVAFAQSQGIAIDVLINNAGISKNGMSWKLAPRDFNEVIAVNLTAPFLLCHGVIPSMRTHNFGRIINISSVVAQTGVPGTVAYAASKAGILGMTKTIAKEVANQSITCNALALGYFDQGMISEVSEELQQQIIAQIPKSRLGGVETILNTIDWLLKEESDYITGQTISLNGGLFT